VKFLTQNAKNQKKNVRIKKIPDLIKVTSSKRHKNLEVPGPEHYSKLEN
jgi:hypothetical protein